MNNPDFKDALENGDIAALRRIPKTDLHNHACLGYSLNTLRAKLGPGIPEPPQRFPHFEAFLDYLRKYLHVYIYTREGFEFSIREALRTAQSDGVSIVEMSIDAQMVGVYGSVEPLASFLRDKQRAFEDTVDFRPEIGINREWSEDRIEEWVMPMIACGGFASIDLYGNMQFGAPEEFVGVYREAKRQGLVLKAHAGEYTDAEFVRRSVELLELDEVQHGIRAAESAEVTRWLADHRIRLNICPTSNVVLGRVESLSDHPIRSFYDAGVPVTINSDDIMIFGQTTSEEYLNLFRAGLFSAGELDEIRVAAIASRR